MSDINPLGSTYYSGLQNAANQAANELKKEKINETKKTSFSKILKSKEEESTQASTQGFPPEIEGMSIEDAAIFLKDAVDIIGDRLADNSSTENLMEFKKAVQNFVRFVVQNNYEVTQKQIRKLPQKSTHNFFSNYSLPPVTEKRVFKINLINEKLDNLTRSMLMNQKDNIKLLAQVNEIKGLIVDFMCS